MVSIRVDDDVTTDVHLTEPTESNYTNSGHVSSTQLMYSTNNIKLSSVNEADLNHAEPLWPSVKLYVYLLQLATINIYRQITI